MARKKKVSQMGEASVPISAMIDVVFLLIIFFVVTASIDKDVEDAEVNLAKAPHGKPVVQKDPRSVIINVRKDGTTNVGMLPISLPSISQLLVNQAAKYGKDIPIVIRGDANTQHQHIKKVMEAVTNTQLYRIKFNAVIEEN